MKTRRAARLILLLLFSFLFLAVGCGQADCRHERIVETAIEPTCSEEGYLLHRCPDCSLQYKTDLTAPRGHQLSSTRFRPTCTEEGYTQFTCACGYQFQSERTAPLGHTDVQTVVAADCTSGGYTTSFCSTCGVSYTSGEASPLGHRFTDTVYPPTCEKHGYTRRECSDCGFIYNVEFLDPVGHTLIDERIAPTCEEEGYVQRRCAACGVAFVSELLPPTGHAFSDFTVQYPTRTKSGTIRGVCSCGYERVEHLFYSDVFGGIDPSTSLPLAKGVDVSKYQHRLDPVSGALLPLDWSAIRKADFDFAILKAGSSRSGKDPVFEQNYREAKAVGLEIGVYFYSYAQTTEEIRSDALTLISWLRGKQLEYPVYLDLEDNSQIPLGKDILTEFCEEFLTILQENGYYGALYTNQNWLTNYLHGDTLRSAFDIWYARYPHSGEMESTETVSWNTEKYGAQAGLWQYTERGVIEGFEEVYFDLNYAYRDYASIVRRYGYNGYTIREFP